jgi:hypothetical protein
MNEMIKISFSLTVIFCCMVEAIVAAIFSIVEQSVQYSKCHIKKKSGMEAHQLPFHSFSIPVESPTNFNGVLGCQRYGHHFQNKSNIARSPPFGRT